MRFASRAKKTLNQAISRLTPQNPQDLRVEPIRCSLFYRYLRLEAKVPPGSLEAWIEQNGTRPPQSFTPGSTIIVEALIDPALFPGQATLTVQSKTSSTTLPLSAFAEATFARNGLGALGRHTLLERVNAFGSTSTERPRLLDLGGRRRSGGSYTDDLAQCDVTVFDIIADPGVDVVGDAHELSGHFPQEHFDFVISISVFEHLLMPWKVALELNQVMRTGGYCFIHTHQTLGMHDLPWDFWRFSDTAWQGLFNPHTGFEIVQTGLGHFIQLVTAGWNERYRAAENSGGFESSGVLIRKTGPARLTWDVKLQDITKTRYPKSRI